MFICLFCTTMRIFQHKFDKTVNLRTATKATNQYNGTVTYHLTYTSYNKLGLRPLIYFIFI